MPLRVFPMRVDEKVGVDGDHSRVFVNGVANGVPALVEELWL
jgi:hypothetical protein